MKIKYVIFGEMDAVLLGSTQNHSDVRSCNAKPTSAGFCSFHHSAEECKFKADVWGESISLKLKSDPRDAYIIEYLLNN